MNSFQDQAIKAGQRHLDAKIDTLQELLSDIDVEKFTEIYQVQGYINNTLDILKDLKGDQYQADANADHVTEQIPNV